MVVENEKSNLMRRACQLCLSARKGLVTANAVCGSGRFATLPAILLLILVCCSPATSQKPLADADKTVLNPVSAKGELYPADADANQELQEALKRAASEKKRVLLVFGGNWCYDCHVLDRALHEGDAGKIVNESFLLVHVDIGEGEKNPELVKAYHIPLNKGVPAVAVLNGEGKLLYSSGDGEFESARTMLKRDLVKFLNHWKKAAPQSKP